MSALIIRDDDASYFTPPWRLEALYGRLWEAGKPVCLALIPWVDGGARVYWTPGNPPDPGIPPAFRARGGRYALADNRELCAFLNRLAKAGLVEICLHGLTHAFFEFITHDRELVGRMLDAGLARLNDALPDASIWTFIPPYDRISPVALEELVARGFHICTRSHNLAPLPSLPQIAGFDAATISGEQTLFVCDDYLFSHKRDPRESLRLARASLAENALTIVANHYWCFFHPWRGAMNAEAAAAWRSFLDEALGDGELEITAFSAYAAQLAHASSG